MSKQNLRCPKCGSSNVQSRGVRIYCKEDHPDKWSEKFPASRSATGTVSNTRTGVTTFSGFVPRDLTEEQLAAHFKIDLTRYKITQVIYSDREVYRKDHKVDIEWEDGKANGWAKDSGDVVVVPLYGVKVTTQLRVMDIENDRRVNELIEDAKKYSPKYKTIKYKRIKEGVLYEPEMPDLQLGRMVSEDETGFELNPDIAVKTARAAMEKLISYADMFPVDQIVFPLGHDFFNSNNADNKTAHNTPQRDDPRWQRTYKLGRQLVIELIDNMSQIAPVHVPIIVGNHDEERMFYLGDALECWYWKSRNVSIDNSGKKRKYFPYGKVLLGFTHGYWEALKNLPHLMAVEEPQLWANSLFREWHTGDKHHEQSIVTQPSKEYPGVTVRILRSLATPSVWEYDKGLLSLKAAEAFVWHPNDGMIAQFRSYN